MRQELFICPRCRATLERVTPERMTCPKDGLEFWNVDGIWRFLLPESEAHYSHFIKDYETIRGAERRGSTSATYYRALPFKDLSGQRAAEPLLPSTARHRQGQAGGSVSARSASIVAQLRDVCASPSSRSIALATWLSITPAGIHR